MGPCLRSTQGWRDARRIVLSFEHVDLVRGGLTAGAGAEGEDEDMGGPTRPDIGRLASRCHPPDQFSANNGRNSHFQRNRMACSPAIALSVVLSCAALNQDPLDGVAETDGPAEEQSSESESSGDESGRALGFASLYAV